MKKVKLILLILCFSLPLMVNAQTGWDEEGVTPNVLMVKQRCYDVDNNKATMQKGEMIRGVVGNNDFVFNERGQRTETMGYGTDGNLEWRAIYIHNSKRAKTEMVLTTVDNVVQGKTTYQYDMRGYIIMEKIHAADGKTVDSITFNCDDKGRKVAAYCYNPTGNLHWSESYEYNAQGYKTGYKHFDESGKVNWQGVFKLDKFGNKVEEGTFDADGNALNHAAYEYEYDNRNNWTRQIIYTVNGDIKTPENIVERELLYF